jgi:hypothetical protein
MQVLDYRKKKIYNIAFGNAILHSQKFASSNTGSIDFNVIVLFPLNKDKASNEIKKPV